MSDEVKQKAEEFIADLKSGKLKEEAAVKLEALKAKTHDLLNKLTAKTDNPDNKV